MSKHLSPSTVLVTGSTGWTDRSMIERVLSDLLTQTTRSAETFRLITGMAEGADEFARDWATANGAELRAELLETGEYPKPMHDYNDKMLSWKPTLVLAFKHNFDAEWLDDGCVAGTEHMARIAAKQGIAVLLNGTIRLKTDSPPDTQASEHTVDNDHIVAP